MAEGTPWEAGTAVTGVEAHLALGEVPSLAPCRRFLAVTVSDREEIISCLHNRNLRLRGEIRSLREDKGPLQSSVSLFRTSKLHFGRQQRHAAKSLICPLPEDATSFRVLVVSVLLGWWARRMETTPWRAEISLCLPCCKLSPAGFLDLLVAPGCWGSV